MAILTLVRNQIPAHEQIINGKWDVSEVARNAFDLEGKVVGTVGCGRIGYRILQRLQPFDCKELLWFDYADLPAGQSAEKGPWWDTELIRNRCCLEVASQESGEPRGDAQSLRCGDHCEWPFFGPAGMTSLLIS